MVLTFTFRSPIVWNVPWGAPSVPPRGRVPGRPQQGATRPPSGTRGEETERAIGGRRDDRAYAAAESRLRLHNHIPREAGVCPLLRRDPPPPERLVAQRGREARGPAPPPRLPGPRTAQREALARSARPSR